MQTKTRKHPRAILISDIHFNIQTLDLASNALRQAIDKSNILNIPLIVAGDIHDSKANIRGECIKAMLDTFELATIKPYVIVANHDRINERSPEHSLEFLRNAVTLIEQPTNKFLGLWLLPYDHDADNLRKFLKTISKGRTLIMHQGIQGSNSGDYIQDKSAITKEDAAGFRVISGHYHTRQTIVLPDGGQWDYIGNPYTLNFGEANDPPKGFQVLYMDGSLEFIPTNLRKHIIYDMGYSDEYKPSHNSNDLAWVKIRGTKEQLARVSKQDFSNVKLDLIPTDTKTSTKGLSSSLLQFEVLDSIIGSLSDTSTERKERLKKLWKDLK